MADRKKMRFAWGLAALGLMMGASGVARAADAAAAQAFATAWIDAKDTIPMMHRGIQLKMERCVKAGFMTPDQLAAAQPRLDAFEAAYVAGFDGVRDTLAAKAASLFATAELRAITAFYNGPMFQRLRREQLGTMTDAMVPRVPGCGDQYQPQTVQSLGAQIVPHMTNAEKMQAFRFAMTPAGQHVMHATPELMNTLVQAMRDDVAHALQSLGSPQAVIDKAQTLPSPVVVDLPPPVPAP